MPGHWVWGYQQKRERLWRAAMGSRTRHCRGVTTPGGDEMSLDDPWFWVKADGFQLSRLVRSSKKLRIRATVPSTRAMTNAVL